MSRWRRFLWLAALWCSVPALAEDPCGNDDGLPTGPLVAGIYDGDLGRAHRVCSRTEAALSGGALMVVDTEAFYGHVLANANLEGSVEISEHGEVFVGVEAVRFDTVIMSVAATYLGVGHTSMGMAWHWGLEDKGAVGVSGKFVLPTAVGLYTTAWPIGFDVGVGSQWQPHPMATIYNQIGFLGSVAVTRGAPQPRAGIAATVGAQFTPVRFFGVVAELSTSMGYTAGLDYAAGGVGIRVGDGKRFGLELAMNFPFAGKERALVAAELRTSVRLGKRPERKVVPKEPSVD